MAECSYARCLQERRLIKRELMKWSKDMLHIAGLERVAEELMGRRKWKHYQEALTRTHLNADQITASIELLNIEKKSEQNDSIKLENNNLNGSNTEPKQKQQQTYEENHRQPQVEEENEVEEQQQKEKHHKQQQQIDDVIAVKLKAETVDEAELHTAKENNISNRTTTTTTSQNYSQEYNNNINNNNNNNTAATTALATKSSPNGELNITKNTSVKAPDPIDSTVSETTTSGKLRPTTPEYPPSPPPAEPIDWKPNDKCYFCVDGKLLTVNAKGELVAESGPAVSEADHTQRLDTDSDSNESSTLASGRAGSLTDNNRINLNKLLTSRLRDLPANMTSMDSMVARLAIQQFSTNWLQLTQQQQQQTNSATPTTSDTSAAAVSPSLKDSPSPSDQVHHSDATGEQPLDLSSKPSPNSSISGDLKTVRTKSSRATPVPTGRRTYSDEDLNHALQDILSGKLGTRKAAVQYQVPRSTLRNKVYKLTMEAKRSNAQTPTELLQLQHELEMDKDMSGDEGDDSSTSTPQPDAHHTLDEQLASRIAASATLRKLCENNGGADVGSGANTSATYTSPKPNTLQPDGSFLTPKLDETLNVSVRDLHTFFSAIILNSGLNLKDILTAASTGAVPGGDSALNNGNANIDQRLLLQQLQQHQQAPQFPVRLPKSETPETTSSLDPNEAFDDPSTILKIPSYKPVAGTSTLAGVAAIAARAAHSPSLLCNSSNNNNNTNSNLNRNGDSPRSAQSPRMTNSMLAAAVAAAAGNSSSAGSGRQNNNISGISPPLMHRHGLHAADSQSPPSFSVRDVMANRIHRTMNEQKDAHAAAVSIMGLNADAEHSGGSAGKKPSISVVKNIGGMDTSRFGDAPNLLAAVAGASSHNSHHHHQHQQHPSLQHAHHSHHSHHSSHHLSRQEAAALAAGKGTRPKRGKYRNYDRDSLVEAVKAVQRGEMSVHRAGSYYGVPHSTLEYKVKERHLMRPRKREPKPQPGLDGTTSTAASKANSNIPNLDKLKAGSSAGTNSKLSAAIKNNNNSSAAFSNTAPNGMKMSIFDQAVAAQMQYPPPHLFWSTSPAANFGHLPMDFNRNPSAQGGIAGNVNADILKRLQEEAIRAAGGGANAPTNANSLSPIASPMSGQSHHVLNLQSARERVENLYDIGTANGSSLLDGIIRQSLVRKNSDVSPPPTSSGALLDQLLVKKTPLPFTNNRSNDYPSSSSSLVAAAAAAAASKRSGSPLAAYSDIKRERTTPTRSSDDDDADDDDASHSGADEDAYEHNNNKSSHRHQHHQDLQHHHQRSRMTSRDSETDGSSIKSELMHAHQNQNHHHHNNASKMAADLNGSGHSEMPPMTHISPAPGGTSILQEKLAQIKAEQESEENL